MNQSSQGARRGLDPKMLLSPLVLVSVIGVIIAVVLAFGWAGAAKNANAWSDKASNLQSELAATNTKLDKYRENAAASDEAKSEALAKQREYDRKVAEVDSQKAQLDEQQNAVVASQLSDGVHVVGTDTEPGTYSTTDTTNCYYAWMTGTGSDAEIVDNNIVSGPATVTLKAGDVFETNRCGTWNKTG
jgi:hypothetical protein